MEVERKEIINESKSIRECRRMEEEEKCRTGVRMGVVKHEHLLSWSDMDYSAEWQRKRSERAASYIIRPTRLLLSI